MQLQDLVEIASRFTFDTPSHKLQLLKSHLLNLRRTAGVPVSAERAVATTDVFAAYRYTAVTAKVEYAAYRSDLRACKELVLCYQRQCVRDTKREIKS